MSRERQMRRLARQYPADRRTRAHVALALACAADEFAAAAAADRYTSPSAADQYDAECRAQLAAGGLETREAQKAALDLLRTSAHARLESLRAVLRRYRWRMPEVRAVGPWWREVAPVALSDEEAR